MVTAPVTRGRIAEFVRWLVRTPWPVFSLGILQADIIGALLVLGFLRFGLPPAERLKLQDLPATNLAIFLSYVAVAFTIGTAISFYLLVPVFRWQRRDSLLTDDDPADSEKARLRALRMPTYRSAISIVLWVVGAIVFIGASWPVARHSAPELAMATLAGATATAIIGYLQSERVLRPVAVAALREGVPEHFSRPGVVLHVLAAADDRATLADVIFAETTTFGLRVVPCDRLYAEEKRESVKIGKLKVGVRLSFVGGRLVTVSPEYEDVRRVAAAVGRPARVVYEAAQAAARTRFSGA